VAGTTQIFNSPDSILGSLFIYHSGVLLLRVSKEQRHRYNLSVTGCDALDLERVYYFPRSAVVVAVYYRGHGHCDLCVFHLEEESGDG